MDIFTELHDANAEESYDWLQYHSPKHLKAISASVKRGATPEDIYHEMLRDTQRQELAHRCRLAARYVASQTEPAPSEADWQAANRLMRAK